MKTAHHHPPLITTLLANTFGVVLFSVFCPLSSVFPQGSLTPPGAPAPTMKTLDQIEPRTLISSLPFTISTPGSYYVTANLTGTAGQNGITITADNVTVDLNGFELAGGTGVSAISVSGARTNVTIRNGTVRGWPSSGVSNFSGTGMQVEHVRAIGNGSTGILLSTSGTATDCEAIGNGATGILGNASSKIIRCTANGQTGANAGIFVGADSVVTDCVANANGSDGITVSTDTVVTDCVANGNGADGIQVGSGSMLIGCTAAGNTSNGFNLGDFSSISSCAADSNTGAGFGGPSPEHCVFTNCAASANSGSGFDLNIAASLQNCSTFNNGGVGILVGEGATVLNCVARSNQGASGISVGAGSTVIGCVARVNNSAATTSAGITASTETLVSQCVASNTTSSAAATTSTGMGINVGGGSTVERCTVQGNKGDGIRAAASCVLMNNTCDGNGPGAGDGAGIHTTGVDNRIESNNVTNNDRGIDIDVAGSLIIKNSASGNPTAAGAANYAIATGNACLVVVTALTAAFTGASGGTALGSTDPWVNFSY